MCLQVKELRGQVEHHRQAHATVSREMEARLHEAQEATGRVAALQGESAELVRRILEMKDREADRLNEMNRQEADMVGWLAGWVGLVGGPSLECRRAGRQRCEDAASHG
jgi:cell division septum initiation protein DivIVA